MNARRETELTPVKNRTAVERTSERELVITRTFNGPARLVFEAWTKPELLVRTLERRGLLSRVPGAARSLRVLVPAVQLPGGDYGASPSTRAPSLNRGATTSGVSVSDAATAAAIAVLDMLMPHWKEDERQELVLDAARAVRVALEPCANQGRASWSRFAHSPMRRTTTCPESGWYSRRTQRGSDKAEERNHSLTWVGGYFDPPRASTSTASTGLWRTVFEKCATGTVALRQLTVWARDEGLRDKNGTALTTAGVHHILRTRLYSGDFDYNGRTCSGTHEPLVTRQPSLRSSGTRFKLCLAGGTRLQDENGEARLRILRPHQVRSLPVRSRGGHQEGQVRLLPLHRLRAEVRGALRA